MKFRGSERSAKGSFRLLAFLFCELIVIGSMSSIGSAIAAVKLNVATTPDNGVAGVNNINLTGSGFPSGTITPGNVSISLASTCQGTAAATATAISVISIIGTSKRINFVVPSSLAKGTYFADISDSIDGIVSTNCSQVSVTVTNPVLSACVPASSLGVLAPVTGPASVIAYVPNGCWGCSTTGIQAVPLEPTPLSPPTSIATANAVNSCAANPATSEAVCVANNTDVYTIN